MPIPEVWMRPRVCPFFKVFEAQPCADRSQRAKHGNINFLNLKNVYFCLEPIFGSLSFAIITFSIYILIIKFCYNNMRKILIKNRSKAKVNFVEFRKTWLHRLLRSISTGLCPKNFEKWGHLNEASGLRNYHVEEWNAFLFKSSINLVGA